MQYSVDLYNLLYLHSVYIHFYNLCYTNILPPCVFFLNTIFYCDNYGTKIAVLWSQSTKFFCRKKKITAGLFFSCLFFPLTNKKKSIGSASKFGVPLLSILQKATRKSVKVSPTELDVTELTDQDLKDELLRHGLDVGPIVGERWGFLK